MRPPASTPRHQGAAGSPRAAGPPGGADGTWIEARGLTKAFGGTAAIAGASLGLRRGEIRGVVGPNGAGKSTLIQMFAGALVPDAGELAIDGAPVRFRTPADALDLGISLVPQETRLAPNLTVTENITLGREPRRLGVVLGPASRRRAREVLGRLRIAIDPDAAVSSLTTVQRRLVMTARAVTSSARLIILDEPTAALAPQEADLILTVVRDLAADGVAFLYVSHRFGDIEAVADTVTGVRDGRVIADLHRDEITRRALVELVTPEDQARAPGTLAARAQRGDGPPARADRLVVTGLRGPGLDGFSVTVEPGQVVGLAGLAGSGADEAIETIAGIRKAAAGTVTLGGRAVPGGDRVAAARAGIAYISGDRSRSSFASHSVRANITMAALSQAATAFVPSAARERREASALAAQVRLSASRLSQPMSTLSGGNQQKAVFARWLATEARVLLLHDPTAGVDVHARSDIHAQVREHAARGVAVVVVSTDLAELADLAERVVIVSHGSAAQALAGEQVSERSITDAMSHPERAAAQ